MNIIKKYNLTRYDSVVTGKSGNITMSQDHNPYPEPIQTVRLGTTGNSARWVQWCLWRFGLLEKSGIDGVIGTKSVTAIKTAQKRLGLNSDGIVGDITRRTFKSVFEQ